MGDNALMAGDAATVDVGDGVFGALEGMEPMVRSVVVLLMVAFVVLVCVACFLCVARRAVPEAKGDEPKDVANDGEMPMSQMHHVATNSNVVTQIELHNVRVTGDVVMPHIEEM